MTLDTKTLTVFEDKGSNIYAGDIEENWVSSLNFGDKDIGLVKGTSMQQLTESNASPTNSNSQMNQQSMQKFNWHQRANVAANQWIICSPINGWSPRIKKKICYLHSNKSSILCYLLCSLSHLISTETFLSCKLNSYLPYFSVNTKGKH